MKIQSKDIYGPNDSPHTFCKYQIDVKDKGFQCGEKIWELINLLDDNAHEDESKDEEFVNCPFTEQTASKCKMYEYHKHNKNKDAKRWEE